MSENNENDQADILSFENENTSSPTEKAFEEIDVENMSENLDSENPETESGENELSELEQLKAEVAEKSDLLLRAAAEVENVRKRGRRDAEEARKFGSTGLLVDLLGIVDNLNRAVEAAEISGESSSLLSGVKMVTGELDSMLEKNQCKKIVALGQPFDPNLHEAIQMQPSEEYAANLVSLEARTGYQYHDRVLRTAQVFVSTGSPQAENDEA